MNKTVLIIDDDDMLRKTLAHGLRDENFNVLTADSAEYGFDILARMRVDAIVLDRMMTGMDGLEMLKKLRASGDMTPVIMLTAMTGAENTIDGLGSGADDYMPKPFQLRELVLRLNNILKKNASVETARMPTGLVFNEDEFFVKCPNCAPKMIALSGEEKKLLQNLTHPMGNIAPASPMVAKRLRSKLNGVLSELDIITIRGRGYKLININSAGDKPNKDKA